MDNWEGSKSRAMIKRLRKQLDEISGARVKLVLFQNGAPINAPVEFRAYGPDQAELKRLAAKMEEVLRETPGTRDVNNPVAFDKVDLDVRVDEAKAALLDVPAGAARRAIRLALSGERAGTYRDTEAIAIPLSCACRWQRPNQFLPSNLFTSRTEADKRSSWPRFPIQRWNRPLPPFTGITFGATSASVRKFWMAL